MEAALATWASMTLLMMLPTAAPMIVTFARVSRRTVASFVAGYVVVWLGFAVVAAWLQTRLGAAHVLGARPLSAALLVVAGVYQLTPYKAACVRGCRTPMAFLMSRWREGHRGAARLGVRHGVDCVGCCWALMALGFVGGTTSLLWMFGATLLMGIEKLPRLGERVTRPLGITLVGAGVATGLLAVV